MFEDTLLIIKSDYLHKRKALLIFILQQGFQILGQRKLLFTPELAAEFYQDLSNDPCFMLEVILLSKGNSEAFILTKNSAVDGLNDMMLCYFGTSIEMERNVHVTKCHRKVKQEISFIFPNYIHEPICCPEPQKFCTNNPLVGSLISELYDIIKNSQMDPHKSWKEKLAEWLILSNKSLPQVSNKCNHNIALNLQEFAQQTSITCFKKHDKIDEYLCRSSLSSGMDSPTDDTLLTISTSSCITCSGFGSGEEFEQHINQQARSTVKESSGTSEMKNLHEYTVDESALEAVESNLGSDGETKASGMVKDYNADQEKIALVKHQSKSKEMDLSVLAFEETNLRTLPVTELQQVAKSEVTTADSETAPSLEFENNKLNLIPSQPLEGADSQIVQAFQSEHIPEYQSAGESVEEADSTTVLTYKFEPFTEFDPTYNAQAPAVEELPINTDETRSSVIEEKLTV